MSRIMHPADLFTIIHTQSDYTPVGLNMDYTFHTDLENRVLYVLFQGSNGALDWFHNLLAIPSRIEPIEGCGFFVHKGFARVWRSGNSIILGKLEAMLERRQFAGFQVVFGGFSHGGPLAMLAGHEWSVKTGRREQCIIFGSPKLAWGDTAVARIQEAVDVTHWLNPADAVTRVPFSRWGFVHVDRSLVIVPGNTLFSIVNISRQHQIYGEHSIYPENWQRAI